jgi:hypothetical protein
MLIFRFILTYGLEGKFRKNIFLCILKVMWFNNFYGTGELDLEQYLSLLQNFEQLKTFNV